MEVIIQGVKIFILLYIISLGIMYYLYSKDPSDPPLMPGDVYKIRAGRRYYFPLSSSLVVTAILYFLIKFLKTRFFG